MTRWIKNTFVYFMWCLNQEGKCASVIQQVWLSKKKESKVKETNFTWRRLYLSVFLQMLKSPTADSVCRSAKPRRSVLWWQAAVCTWCLSGITGSSPVRQWPVLLVAAVTSTRSTPPFSPHTSLNHLCSLLSIPLSTPSKPPEVCVLTSSLQDLFSVPWSITHHFHQLISS